MENQHIASYLGIIQGNIGRMSDASRSCKQVAAALVTAIIAVAATSENLGVAFSGIVASFFFALLDAYYLALERQFVRIYNEAVDSFHESKLDSQLFKIKINNDSVFQISETLRATTSLSIYCFYLLLIFGCVIVAKSPVILKAIGDGGA